MAEKAKFLDVKAGYSRRPMKPGIFHCPACGGQFLETDPPHLMKLFEGVPGSVDAPRVWLCAESTKNWETRITSFRAAAQDEKHALQQAMKPVIIASEFTEAQAVEFIENVKQRPAAELFDEFLQGKVTEGELRGWLHAIDDDRKTMKAQARQAEEREPVREPL